jgi:hypothetical protein
LHTTGGGVDIRRFLVSISAAFLALPAAAAGHGLFDHAPPTVTLGQPPPPVAVSGGEGAMWEFVTTLFTGNPHTDIDFFTQRGETYASVGTLAAGPNGGGQTLVQLTKGGAVEPEIVSFHPSASCVSNPNAALGLQHDVEAAPKGQAILNADVLAADRRDAQIVLDATDAEGRCHDQGVLGVEEAPQGGLEIVDVTNLADPVEIGLTSHIGEAHTVNVDPKRPHIAYAITSDSVGVDAQGKRANETSGLALDGFEVVDLSSCMNFPAGATVEQKRAACRPQVYRYRYPSPDVALGHTNKGALYACHEVEIYPDDRLACASGGVLMLLDMKGAFDDAGTPTDFSDDKPRGTPLPCQVRDSTTAGPFTTGAKVTDCVTGLNAADLSVKGWLASGAPSLEGVRYLGSAFHMGRESTTGAADPAFDATKDIDFDHEAEFTASGRFLLATDERGGGVAPPGATCSPGVDNVNGNGGVHAYKADALLDHKPASPEEAFGSYAKNSKGERAIIRMPVRTGPQPSLCTAHVFHQIPGQNRIFMGWYSQGTHVIDFEERPDGTIDMKEVAWFIPTHANEWVSAVFKVDRNPDGTFTYWGATGDFNVVEGRNAIDIYKVTLPPPPAPLGRLAGTGKGFAPPRCVSRRARFSRRGLGRLRLGARRKALLRRAGRPVRQQGRVWRYCVNGERRARVLVVFGRGKRGRVRLVASTARRHRARGVAAGARARRVRGGRRIGPGLRARGRFVFRTKLGRVRYVAVADRRLSRRPRSLRGHLRKAGLR